LGRRAPLTDDEIVAILAGFQLPVPTITDEGAVAGVRRLLADAQVERPFTVRTNIAAALRSHIGTDPALMSKAEQATAFAQLDAVMRASDQELWRSKQVSDFLAGIWAQGYGQIYLDGIDAFFHIRRAARITLVIAMMTAVWLRTRRRVAPTVATAATTA